MILRLLNATKSTLLFFIEEIADATTTKTPSDEKITTLSPSDPKSQIVLTLD